MTTKPKKFCFVLMPFTEDFDDTYKLGIKQSCLDAGAYCERVDEQIFNESILERIYNQISKADIIIADMTGRNPNVFYEVGYAHALGKTTILLTRDASDIPFDLKHYPHIIYNSKITKLKEELENRLRWHINNDAESEVDYKIGLELFFNGNNISYDDISYITPSGHYPKIPITIYNNSFHTYNPYDFRIGVITDQYYHSINNENSKTTILPDGRNLHLLESISDILYPSSYSSFEIKLRSGSNYFTKQKIFIRLFTSAGARDYPLIVDYLVEKSENAPQPPHT